MVDAVVGSNQIGDTITIVGDAIGRAGARVPTLAGRIRMRMENAYHNVSGDCGRIFEVDFRLIARLCSSHRDFTVREIHVDPAALFVPLVGIARL